MPVFPVTDPSRADDIRMRRRRAVLLLGGIGVSAFLLFGRGMPDGAGRNGDGALQDRWTMEQGRLAAERGRMAAEQGRLAAQARRRAAEEERRAFRSAPVDGSVVVADGREVRRDFPVSGPVTVDVPCTGGLHLAVRSGGGDRVTAVASTGDEHGAVALGGLTRQGATISGDCAQDRDARITVIVPQGHALTVVQTGDADITGERFVDPVTVQVNGSGDVKLQAAGALTAEMHGSGDVTVGEVNGPLTAAIHESGDLRVGGGEITALSAVLDGSGDLDLGPANVGSASLRGHGDGTITIRHVDTALDAELYGDGDLTIDRIDAGSARVIQQGNGKIAIRGGTIDRLDAVRNGDGTLSILAAVKDGTLSQGGDGITEIPHGTLRMVPSGH